MTDVGLERGVRGGWEKRGGKGGGEEMETLTGVAALQALDELQQEVGQHVPRAEAGHDVGHVVRGVGLRQSRAYRHCDHWQGTRQVIY